MELEVFTSEISKRFGNVKRARGCFLYTEKGVRLTDLFQEGGRAILGWGGNSAFTVLKNVLSRGLTGSFPTVFDLQLKKAVSELLDSRRSVSVFFDREKAVSAAEKIAGKPLWWKPWIQDGIAWNSEAAVLIEPPLAWAQNLYILATLLPDDCKTSAENESIVQSCMIPAVLASAAARSIYNMIAALQARGGKDWYIFDPEIKKYWTRSGPYLYPKVPEKVYDRFVLHCLDCAVAVSPCFEIPSIVPFGAERGVFGKLKAKPFEF